jgi:hypothetical protein
MDEGLLLLAVVVIATLAPLTVIAGILYGLYRLLRARARKRLDAKARET